MSHAPIHMELLAPAGGMEQLKAAILFGADAVYLAGQRFGMRARAANFSLDDIREAVRYAHERNVAVHVTCNILMDQSDLDELPAYLSALDDAGVDALIISDLGALALARQYAPHVELHVSTQASVANALAAKAWYDLGARRVVCAREMSLEDIRTMRAQLPDDMQIEAFAHGAMCMAVSGRCLISSYMTSRSGNKGNCAQSCRWNYVLEEEKRPGEYYPIEEDGRGTFIMNAKDMNMLDHLQALKDAGVDSIKIEGRNKKAFYVATVVNAYRQVLDGADPAELQSELTGISHRPYSTGFYYDEPGQSTEIDGYTQDSIHVADITDCVQQPDGSYLVTVFGRNRFTPGEPLEALVPHVPPIPVEMSDLRWYPEAEDASFLEKRLKKEHRREARDRRIAEGMEMTSEAWTPPPADLENEGLDYEDVSAFIQAVRHGDDLPSIRVESATRSKATYTFNCPDFLTPGGFLRVRRFHQAASRSVLEAIAVQ